MNLDLRNSHTQPYKCKIKGKPCKGRVSVNEDKHVFLCQNEKDGCGTDNKLGYPYSWRIQFGSERNANFKDTGITDFEFITEEELGEAPSSISTSLDGKEIEVKIDGVSYQAILTVKK